MILVLQLSAVIAMQTGRGKPQKAAGSPADVASVRKFVQGFYDWYAPRAYQHPEMAMVALQSKADEFSPEIRSAFHQYLLEQGKVKDMKVGFDPDPFVDWGQTYKRYSVGEISRKGDTWLAAMNSVPPSPDPLDLTVEVVKSGRGWMFADFRDTSDSLLKKLRGLKSALQAIEAFLGGPPRPSSRADIASVRRFGQHFYDWYADKVAKEIDRDSEEEADVLALKTKPEMFTPQVRSALLADREAQEKDKDYIVGIDWDPFLGGQDPARHYRVRKIEHRGQDWLLTVWSVYGQQTHQPDVIAKVEKSNGGWRFVNFLYSDNYGSNLLDTLSELKKDREKPGSGAAGKR